MWDSKSSQVLVDRPGQGLGTSLWETAAEGTSENEGSSHSGCQADPLRTSKKLTVVIGGSCLILFWWRVISCQSSPVGVQPEPPETFNQEQMWDNGPSPHSQWPQTIGASILVDSTLRAGSYPPWVQEAGSDGRRSLIFYVGGQLL